MNIPRLALAAVVATIVDSIYGFTVYGMLLAGEFGKYPAVYRSTEAGQAYLPLMFGGIFIAILVASAIYAKGYEGGSGVVEGLRFGLMLGVFVFLAFGGVNYAVLNIGRRLALYAAAAGLVEWTLVGVAIGLVYKPSQPTVRHSTGV
jgi:hypothetical protein